jgi:3'-5' exoribonuclease
MGRTFIADIQPGDSLEQAFLVRETHLRTQRNGAFYIDLELVDRTGAVPAKVWDASQELFESFAADDFVKVVARGETYRRKLQLVVTALERLDPAAVDLEDFLPSTRKDVRAMVARLRVVAAGLRNRHLKALLAAFLDDRAFLARFQRAPAAVEIHHAWLGGLLEHTVAVTELALHLADAYPNLDRDLLLAGAILHDIGKVDSFDYARGIRYTDVGGLVGHLPLGLLAVTDRARQLDGFPQPLLERLQHLILSHHGEYQYGSPNLPATAEAIALHYLDNLDAKLNAFERALLADVDERSRWTDWNRIFERRLFKGTR